MVLGNDIKNYSFQFIININLEYFITTAVHTLIEYN